MFELLFVTAIALLITIGTSNSRAGERDQQRSYYDRNGGFAGSSIDHGKDASFYDRDGRFSGSAIRNSDGTTSFYNKSGHFTGSSTDTTQRK